MNVLGNYRQSWESGIVKVKILSLATIILLLGLQILFLKTSDTIGRRGFCRYNWLEKQNIGIKSYGIRCGKSRFLNSLENWEKQARRIRK